MDVTKYVCLGLIVGNCDQLISQLKSGIFKSFLYATIAVNSLQILDFFMAGILSSTLCDYSYSLVAIIIFPKKSKSNLL